MDFCKGDRVEVCSKEQGFEGSHFAATVITQLANMFYVVQHVDLVEEEDESKRLIEVVGSDEVRPMPPTPPKKFGYYPSQRVDAWDKDAWWVGKISGNKGSDYSVYFEGCGEELVYPLDRLRVHLDWMNGKWVSLLSN